jgi:phosphoribosylformylglycinamidine synthase II
MSGMKPDLIKVDSQLAANLGLLDEEYDRIIKILGRTPTYTELGMFSAMWSEHCSYKNSIKVLRMLPRSGPPLLVSAGEENAGLVDIGDGLAVAFKIESHNHPSAVEPYQGAATGVGGILRDIFTMGARPIAALNSLRFGDPNNSRFAYLIKGIVKGIGDYGNSFGVPTVAGEIYFDESYTDNPLVNAMAVGIVERDKIARAAASGAGNAVLIVGSSTGRDGIHGATFASEKISSDSEMKRPSVQVGDPFTEKLLLEATLEVIGRDLLVGIQDMGAAGITCSASEMSARGRVGMRIDLDRVPVRETGMSSYEIMLSESQERMLIVSKRGREDEIKSIYAKWDVPATVIGEVLEERQLRVFQNGVQVANLQADSLVLGGGAPEYERESREPAYLASTRMFEEDELPEPENLEEVLLTLLRSPNVASKAWVFQQYDSSVRTNTLPWHLDAGIIRIKGTKKALAVSTDCNARYVYLNPFNGGAIAVAEAARNVVCTGARPLAITNCLNFGDPYDAEVYWQFKESARGISEACRVLGTPVTGGNVSFYNGSEGQTIYPTPVIGMVGLIEDVSKITPSTFQEEGDAIFLLGELGNHVGGSEYLKVIHGLVSGDAPAIDLTKERKVQQACLEMIGRGLLKSAHDISDGGLAVAIAECCVGREDGLGATISVHSKARRDFSFFGESQSRIIVTAEESSVEQLRAIAAANSVVVTELGMVGGENLVLDCLGSINLQRVRKAYHGRLHEMVGERVT